jgi:protein-S-isoprenylcysteine O-methyltransferase Ste14
MVSIGNFFFKYRNLLFPIFALTIFIPSAPIFSPEVFGENYYTYPMAIGIVIAILGQVVRAVTIGLKYIKRGGKDKKVYAEDLVTDGLFQHCRNPLYVGNILMLVGVGILSNSLFFLLIVVPVFCFIYQAIVRAEENFLRNKFGPAYDRYTADVNRWIPSFKGLFTTINSMEFNWKRYVINEYNTVYLLLISIAIVLFIYHPELASLEDQQKVRMAVIVFLSISAIYLFVRYLKKSKKLVPA